MPKLSIAKVHGLAVSVGLDHEKAVIATAIAMGESGLRTDAVGDTTLTDATWGPSIGLWQIRSLKSQRGQGLVRDELVLKNPTRNALSMASISSHGTNWTPWSVYNSGAYKAHIGAVRAAVGRGSTVVAPTPSGPIPPISTGSVPGIPIATGGDFDPLPGGGGLPGYADDLFGGGGFDVPGLPSGDEIEGALIYGLLYSAAFGLAVTLIAIGAWRAVQ